jgi:hypothetical protein
MTSLRPDGNCECSPSLTRSLASRRRSNLGSTSVVLMLWRYLKTSAGVCLILPCHVCFGGTLTISIGTG